jgi:hypothetical protein
MAHQGNTWGQERRTFIGGSDARMAVSFDLLDTEAARASIQ